MTTPEPTPGSGPLPDDATSAYEAPPPGAAARPAPSPPDAPASPDPLIPPAPLTPPVPPAAGGVPPAVPPPAGGWGASPAAAPGTAWDSPAADGSPRPAPPPARPGTPPGLVAGVVLVIIGAAILVSRLVELNLGTMAWPLWIVVPGAAMLIGSFFIPPRGGVGLAIPGAIVTIVGLILWVQETYDLYATWAYAWALVAPTGPGLGMLLYGIVHRDGELIADGGRTALVGLGLFLGFALFFEGVIGLSGAPLADLDQILPYAVIGLGILLVVLSFFGGGRRRRRREERRAR